MKTTTMTLIKMINWVKIINFASINGYIDHIIIRPKWAEPFENYSKTVKYWKKKRKNHNQGLIEGQLQNKITVSDFFQKAINGSRFIIWTGIDSYIYFNWFLLTH